MKPVISNVKTAENPNACWVCSYSKTKGFGTCSPRRQKFIKDSKEEDVVDCYCPRGSGWIMEDE